MRVCFSLGILMGMKWYLIVVLICISLVVSDAEHLFTGLLTVCIFGEVSFQVFCLFFS